MRIPIPEKIRLELGGIASERDRRRAYSDRGDKWGRGFIQNPIYCGLAGEFVVCEFLRSRGIECRWDPKAVKYDTDGDILAAGQWLEVKTKSKPYTGLLLRRIDERKRLRAFRGFGVISCIDFGDAVELEGFVERTALICDSAIEKGKFGDYWNKRIEGADLKPIEKLPARLHERAIR